MNISTLDLSILVGYFIVIFIVGYYVARQTKTSEDLFLGGRSFTWGVIGLSLFASNISSSTIIGLSGAAYTTGIVNSVYEWMSALPLIIAAVIFVPLYLKARITTIPEFLEYRFDVRSRVFFSVVTIIMSVIVELAGGLYAGAIVLGTFFPGMELWQISLLVAFVTASYTAFGGLKAVVYTDAMQAVILIVGCAVMTILLFEKFDYNWANVLTAASEAGKDANHFSVVRPLDDKALPWPGLLIGVPFLGFWYWTTNQFIVQRVLGAKDVTHARWGVMFAGLLKFIPLFLMVFPGAMAIGLYPNIENGDMVFPVLMQEVLPVGLFGLVLAGLISAVMSSVDSILNSASTLIVVDFIEPYSKNISETQKMNYGKGLTFVLMFIAAILAPQIQHFQSLWDYLQQMFSIVVPPIVVIFLVGVFYKRGNGHGSFAALVGGTLLGIFLFVLSVKGLWNLHYTMNVGICIVFSALLFVVASLLTAPPTEAQIGQFTYRKELLSEGMDNQPWYLDYRFHSALLIFIVGYILYLFW
jgi:solute:Na+ symporter, SSS family